LGENIADAGGLSASFHAWKKRDSSHADKALPGLEKFTKEQLFFISYSNWWCSKTTKEAGVQAIYTDPHAPKPARILVSLLRFSICQHTNMKTGYDGQLEGISGSFPVSTQGARMQTMVNVYEGLYCTGGVNV
jgi:hypothetical protein